MEFQIIYSNESSAMMRAAVPGGWVYLHKSFEARRDESTNHEYTTTVSESMVFVPEVTP